MRVPQPELERIRYHNRQMLASRDLNDQLTVDAELRAWHNRAMHNSYGIVRGMRITNGLRASFVDASRSIRVRPGLAYDCYGRPLLLQSARDIPIPASVPGEAGSLVLVIRFRERRLGITAPRAICPDEWKKGRRESPEFVWLTPDQVAVRFGVPLAEVVFGKNSPPEQGDMTLSIQRPDETPRVASGQTAAGGTDWQQWTDSRFPDSLFGVQVNIDTSAEGFCRIPCYFAGLQLAESDGSFIKEVLRLVIRQWPLHIENSSIYGFTVRLLPIIPTSQHTAFISAETTQAIEGIISLLQENATVSWLGIQSDSHHIPKFHLLGEA